MTEHRASTLPYPPIAPITALEFVSEIIVSGEGSYCHIYGSESNTKLDSCKIFLKSVIHGIRIDESDCTLCIFGGRSVRTASVKNNKLLPISEEIHLDDWVWDCRWLDSQALQLVEDEKRTTGRCIAAVLGHNSVVCVEITTGAILQRVQGEDYCILYSAHIIGGAWKDLIVAAGTVFNEVVLWPAVGSRTDENRAVKIHSLGGHKGVIMSIHYNKSSRILCSASDDRSIRVWHVGFGGKSSSAKSNKVSAASVNSTESEYSNESASLPIDVSGADWCNAHFEVIHVLFGHKARVWSARCLSDCFVSVGEDACCCIWKMDGSILDKYEGQEGQSIWCLAISEDESRIVTGGNDSSLRIWNRSHGSAGRVTTRDLRNPASFVEEVIERDTCLKSSVDCNSTSKESSKAEDFPRVVQLLGTSHVLVMSSEGHLMVYDIKASTWVSLGKHKRYSSYSVVAVHSGRSLVAVGSITGYVRILSLNLTRTVSISEECEAEIFEGKIHYVHWLQSTAGNSYLLSSGPDRKLVLSELGDSSCCLTPVSRFTLSPSAKQCWVTAVCLFSSSLMADSVPTNEESPEDISDRFLRESCVITGDRNGSVNVFTLDGSDIAAQTFDRIHGRLGVTDICSRDELVYSCGRDGQYNVYRVLVSEHRVQVSRHRVQGNTFKLQHLHSVRVATGFDWISRLLFTQDDILLLGFHSNELVLYSQSSKHQLLSVPCGGGHRTWDFSSSDDLSTCQFVYINSRNVMLCCSQIPVQHVVVKPSLHISEITSARLISLSQTTAGVSRIICTAGNDGKLNVIKLQSQNSSVSDTEVCSERPDVEPPRDCTMNVQMSARRHCSSIRAITSVDSLSDTGNRTDANSNTKILFSVGSRGQLCIWRLNTGNVLSDEFSKTFTKSETSGISQSGNSSGWLKLLVSYGGKRNHKGKKWRLPGDSMEEDPDFRFMDVIAVTAGDILSKVTGADCQSEETGVKVNKPAHKQVAPDSSKTRRFKIVEVNDNDTDVDRSRAQQTAQLRHLGLHFIITAASDGLIRIFSYNESNNELVLIAQSSFLSHCFLKISHIYDTDTSSTGRIYVVAAGTNGMISIFDVTDVLLSHCISAEKSKTGSTAENSREILNSVETQSANNRISKYSDCGENPLEVQPVNVNDRKCLNAKTSQDAQPAYTYRHDDKSNCCDDSKCEISGDSCESGSSTCIPVDSRNTSNSNKNSTDDSGSAVLCHTQTFDSKVPHSNIDDSYTSMHDTSVDNNEDDDSEDSVDIIDDSEGSVDIIDNFSTISVTTSKTYSRTVNKGVIKQLDSPVLCFRAHQSGVNSILVRTVPSSAAQGVQDGRCKTSASFVKTDPLEQSKGDRVFSGSGRIVAAQSNCCAANTSDTASDNVSDYVGGHYMMISGGDDGALTLHLLSITSSEERSIQPQIISHCAYPSAHTAQITGLYAIDNDMVASVAGDQRLTLWSVKNLASNIQLEPITSIILDVADVYGIEGWKVGNTISSESSSSYELLIYGVGIQLVRVTI